ncbi:porin family protein [Spirosoma daeguense]
MGLHIGQENTSTANFFSPQIQYFLADRWSVSVVGRYQKERSNQKLSYLGAGGSVRYYFIKADKYALFGQAEGLCGKNHHGNGQPASVESSQKTLRNTNWQTNTSIGIQYQLRKRLTVEAIAGKNWFPSSYPNLWQTSVGIQYQLKK